MLCALLSVFVSTGAIYSPRAAAAVIATDALLAMMPEASASDSQALAAREALRTRLTALGVDPAVVQARVDAMTAEEANRLATRLDSLPAGGDAVGAVIFVFLVLLVTDILGYTDVYPFITRTVNGDKCVDHAQRTPRDTIHTSAVSP